MRAKQKTPPEVITPPNEPPPATQSVNAQQRITAQLERLAKLGAGGSVQGQSLADHPVKMYEIEEEDDEIVEIVKEINQAGGSNLHTILPQCRQIEDVSKMCLIPFPQGESVEPYNNIGAEALRELVNQKIVRNIIIEGAEYVPVLDVARLVSTPLGWRKC